MALYASAQPAAKRASAPRNSQRTLQRVMRNAENAATMPNVYIYDVVSSCPSVASTPNSRITAGRALVSMLWLTEATKVPTSMATSTTFGLNCFSTNGMP